MGNRYSEPNARELEHLITLTKQLTTEQLQRPLSAGWTVSGVLAHLAFWDLRGLTLINKWQRDGITPSPIDIDIVNEAMRELCVAIAPFAAIQLVIDSARAIDDAIDQLDDVILHDVAARGTTVHLNRAAHRQQHLGQIEQALRGEERGVRS